MKLETLNELLDSDEFYGTHPLISSAKEFVFLNMPIIVDFFEKKRLKENCTDVPKCVERMITKRDIPSFLPPHYATYVVRDLGTVDVGKIICTLDETVVSRSAIIF
jgi:hypothetical protein